MQKKIEFKTFEFELKEVNDNQDEGRIEGYASAFKTVDFGLDIVDKGAFKKTIKESKGRFPILADHNPADQIGWNEKASEDEYGLLVSGALMLNVQKAREKYALAKKAIEIGARAGLSIGYTTIKAEPDQANPGVRRLKELKLWEYSIVTFPMNTDALITAAKSVGGIDRAQFLIKQLLEQGISFSDLELALRKEAAQVDQDPTKVSQALENLITKFRNY